MGGSELFLLEIALLFLAVLFHSPPCLFLTVLVNFSRFAVLWTLLLSTETVLAMADLDITALNNWEILSHFAFDKAELVANLQVVLEIGQTV